MDIRLLAGGSWKSVEMVAVSVAIVVTQIHRGVVSHFLLYRRNETSIVGLLDT